MRNHEIVHAQAFGSIVGVVKYDQSDGVESPREWDNVTTMACWHRRYRLGDRHDKKSESFDSDKFKLGLVKEALGHSKFGWYAEQCMQNDSDAWETHADAIIAKHFEMQPLFLYEHGGITISTGPFSCQWDSGQVGFVYVGVKKAASEFISNMTAEKLKKITPKDWDLLVDVWEYNEQEKVNKVVGKQTLRERVWKCIETEVRTYDDFLTGQIYEIEFFDFTKALIAGEIDAVDLTRPDQLDYRLGESLERCSGYIGDQKYCVAEMQCMAQFHVQRAQSEIAESQYWAERDVVTVGE